MVLFFYQLDVQYTTTQKHQTSKFIPLSPITVLRKSFKQHRKLLKSKNFISGLLNFSAISIFLRLHWHHYQSFSISVSSLTLKCFQKYSILGWKLRQVRFTTTECFWCTILDLNDFRIYFIIFEPARGSCCFMTDFLLYTKIAKFALKIFNTHPTINVYFSTKIDEKSLSDYLNRRLSRLE